MAEGLVERTFPLGTVWVGGWVEVKLEVPDPLRFEAGAGWTAAIDAAVDSSSFSRHWVKSSMFCAIAVRDALALVEPAECMGVDIGVGRAEVVSRGGTRD